MTPTYFHLDWMIVLRRALGVIYGGCRRVIALFDHRSTLFLKLHKSIEYARACRMGSVEAECHPGTERMLQPNGAVVSSTSAALALATMSDKPPQQHTH